jgi:hypothetical protein
MTAVSADFGCPDSGILLRGWKSSYLHMVTGVAGESRGRFLRQAVMFVCSGEQSGVVEGTGKLRNCTRSGLLPIFNGVHDIGSKLWHY